MTITEKAVYIYNILRKAGITHAGAIGTIGNLQGETSDLNPMRCQTSYLNMFGLTDAEYTNRADNGKVIYNGKYFENDSAGYGIVQWTYYMRKRNLLNYAKSLGKSVGDLDVQIAFMLKEMQEDYTSVWRILSTTNSYSDAVEACVTKYEKPGNQPKAITTRCAYAKVWMDVIKDGEIIPDKPKESDKEETGKMTKTEAIEKLITHVKAEIGYKEKRSNSQLDDKTANAGSKNWNKYAHDIDQKYPNFYNGKKNGYAWCDIFVDWNFINCFGYENALAMLYQPEHSYGAGCTNSANYYKRNGAFYTSPEVGDQIFFGDPGNEGHTGIVVAVNGSIITTVEGNTSGGSGINANGDGVYQKVYNLNQTYIPGFGRPNWGALGLTNGTITPSKHPELSKGMSGSDVKKAQQLLIAKGYSCGRWGADGDFGDGTYNAVIAIQRDCGFKQTGVIDDAVWAILLDKPLPGDEKKDEVKPTPEPTPEPIVDVTFNPPTLKKGDKGVAVKKLQHLLIDSGVSVGIWGADGDFGNGTVKAVKSAQQKAGKTVTGIADKYVWAYLINA